MKLNLILKTVATKSNERKNDLDKYVANTVIAPTMHVVNINGINKIKVGCCVSITTNILMKHDHITQIHPNLTIFNLRKNMVTSVPIKQHLRAALLFCFNLK